MEIPDLVRERLGDEEIRAGVTLGDEDVVCLTPTRTIVYRGEGLLSDESVTVLSLDAERVDVTEGRRKTTFTLAFVEGTESFAVPSSRGDKVLELLMDGILRLDGVIGPEESVHGVYRFSELTLVLTDERLVKHVGSSVWDGDFEEFPFAALTGLDFEEGSVATQIVISVDGRPQRIKAPNDEAPMLRQTLEQAVFAYHDVDSLAALNEAVAEDDPADETDDAPAGGAGSLSLDDGIDPLVGGDDPPDTDERMQAAGNEVVDANPAGDGATGDATTADASNGSTAAGGTSTDGRAGSTRGSEPAEPASVDAGAVSRADVDEIGDQLESLTTTVKRQNELLRKQQQTIQQLIEELRQGR